jgi:hypothetical protein
LIRGDDRAVPSSKAQAPKNQQASNGRDTGKAFAAVNQTARKTGMVFKIRLSEEQALGALKYSVERVVSLHCDIAQGTRTDRIEQDFFERRCSRIPVLFFPIQNE